MELKTGAYKEGIIKCPKNYLTGRKSYSNINPPAEVVKLVDTQRSGRCARKGMGVRVPPSALPVFRRPPMSSTRSTSQSNFYPYPQKSTVVYRFCCQF